MANEQNLEAFLLSQKPKKNKTLKGRVRGLKRRKDEEKEMIYLELLPSNLMLYKILDNEYINNRYVRMLINPSHLFSFKSLPGELDSRNKKYREYHLRKRDEVIIAYKPSVGAMQAQELFHVRNNKGYKLN